MQNIETAAYRAKAYVILAFASMAEQPVKNCTRITKNHIAVPPVLPPAFRNICATGKPVGVVIIPLMSDKQKQKVMVSIHPTIPDTRIAILIARGPLIAASWVSSDILELDISRRTVKVEKQIHTVLFRHSQSSSTQPTRNCASNCQISHACSV